MAWNGIPSHCFELNFQETVAFLSQVRIPTFLNIPAFTQNKFDISVDNYYVLLSFSDNLIVRDAT